MIVPLVDDFAGALEAWQVFLAAAGFTVPTATDGRPGLELQPLRSAPSRSAACSSMPGTGSATPSSISSSQTSATSSTPPSPSPLDLVHKVGRDMRATGSGGAAGRTRWAGAQALPGAALRRSRRRVVASWSSTTRPIAEITAMLLTGLGCDVQAAHDGESGLRAAKASRPGRAVRLVAVSRWGREDDLQRNRDAGVDLSSHQARRPGHTDPGCPGRGVERLTVANETRPARRHPRPPQSLHQR